jgi:hypothetical protein
MDEPTETEPARTPQPRWIGFVVIFVAVVLMLAVLSPLRRRIKRFMGV